MGGGDGRGVGGDARDRLRSRSRWARGRGGTRRRRAGDAEGRVRDGRDGREGGRLSGPFFYPDARDVHRRPIFLASDRSSRVSSRKTPTGLVSSRPATSDGPARRRSRAMRASRCRGSTGWIAARALLAWLEGEGCSHAVRFGETPPARAWASSRRATSSVARRSSGARRVRDAASGHAPLARRRRRDGRFQSCAGRPRGRAPHRRQRSACSFPPPRARGCVERRDHLGRWAYVRALPRRRTHPRAPALVVRRGPSPTTRGNRHAPDVLEDRAELERLSRALADAKGVPSDPTASGDDRRSPKGAAARPSSMGARGVLVARHRALRVPRLVPLEEPRRFRAGLPWRTAPSPLSWTRVTTTRRGARRCAPGVSRRTRRRARRREGRGGAHSLRRQGERRAPARHGFVVPDNPADVCPLTLDELMTKAETEVGRRRGRRKGTARRASKTGGRRRGAFSFLPLPRDGSVRDAARRIEARDGAPRRGVCVEGDVRDAVEGARRGRPTRGKKAAAAAAARRARGADDDARPPTRASGRTPRRGSRRRRGRARRRRGGSSPRAEGAAARPRGGPRADGREGARRGMEAARA